MSKTSPAGQIDEASQNVALLETETIHEKRARLRAVIERHNDVAPCPECGLVDPEFKRARVYKDWCPELNY